jgi:LmbE family N-acetylglucosaminyl deacetylase
MNLLCLIAHPDDETILCGGTLALLAARGANIHLACLTRGEGGELGEPPLTDRDHLGEAREQELVCAAQKLGCKSLTFLGYVDPVVGPDNALFAPEHDPVMLAGQIVNMIKQAEAAVVITHGANGEYGHPAHLLMRQATLAAVAALHQESGVGRQESEDSLRRANVSPLSAEMQRPLFYTFSAAFPEHPYPRLLNQDDSADLILDVSAYLDQKEAAALCHKTQNALFVRRRSQQAGRQLTVREALIAVESLHRVFGQQGDELSRMLAGT